MPDTGSGGVSPWGIGEAALVSSAVLLAITLAAARRQGPAWPEKLRLGRSAAAPLGVAAATCGVVSLSLACGAAIELLDISPANALDRMAIALARPSHAELAFSVASIALIPGIAEEAFFRGLLQTRIAAAWGKWPAIATSSLAFGAVHFDLVQGSVAFVVGAFLAWTADRLGGVRPGMAAHALNNAAFVLLAATGRLDLEGSRQSNAILVVLGSLVTVVAVAVLKSEAALRKGVTAQATIAASPTRTKRLPPL